MNRKKDKIILISNTKGKHHRLIKIIDKGLFNVGRYIGSKNIIYYIYLALGFADFIKF